jgi:hypothetical protein
MTAKRAQGRDWGPDKQLFCFLGWAYSGRFPPHHLTSSLPPLRSPPGHLHHWRVHRSGRVGRFASAALRRGRPMSPSRPRRLVPRPPYARYASAPRYSYFSQAWLRLQGTRDASQSARRTGVARNGGSEF